MSNMQILLYLSLATIYADIVVYYSDEYFLISVINYVLKHHTLQIN